jgi:peptide/nickel transport system permease protein
VIAEPAVAPAAVSAGSARRSPARLALRRFGRNRAAVTASVVLALVVLAAVFAPLIARYSPDQVDLNALTSPPSAQHWLGTDTSGRDIFARTLYAGRVSLLVGGLAALVSIVIGTLLGAVAGLSGTSVDMVIMRLADIVLSFPSIVVMIVLAGLLGPSIEMLVIAIGVTHWPQTCRLVRGVTLEIREMEYVSAARAAGARTWWLIRKHVIPASLPPVIVTATLAVATAVLLEATMSFLGLGVQPPQASWGNMLTDAQSLTLIESAPWVWLPPGIAIAITVLAVNFIGDGLHDALDPRQANRGRG